MSRFLISFYPVNPWRSFLCFEINKRIDIGEDAKSLLEEYYRGLKKHGKNEGDLIFFNNSSWQLIEADSVLTAIDKFKENLKLYGEENKWLMKNISRN